jgi:dihydrofolate reductase
VDARRLVVTTIDTIVDGDVGAPVIRDDWQLTSREPQAGWAESTGGLRYWIGTYER